MENVISWADGYKEFWNQSGRLVAQGAGRPAAGCAHAVAHRNAERLWKLPPVPREDWGA